MLDLAPVDSRPGSDVLDAPGGFAWWYADLMDADGTGIVLIWSWGLPFLPGTLRAARAGRGLAPRAQPSLNVAVYEQGVQTAYLLQAYRPEQVQWNGARHWRWAGSSFMREQLGGRTRLTAELDCALPGTTDRLRGTVQIEGPTRTDRPTTATDDRSGHVWAPLVGPSRGRMALSIGSHVVQAEGVGYLDRNESARPLDDLGFQRWTWGRTVVGDELLVWYVLWPDDGGPPACHILRIDDRGRARQIPGTTATVRAGHRGPWGLPGWGQLEVSRAGRPWFVVDRSTVLEEGPFYRRCRVSVRLDDGRTGHGVSELCEPGRVDRWHQPLVQMCVHRPEGPNSFWLPLFAGARAGRLQRMLGAAVGMGATQVSP